MLTFDHLVVVAPDLAEGVAHVRACLDLDVPEGGRHREMGARNHLLRLSEATFLEVIAVDDDAATPVNRRWFGLSDAAAVRADWDRGRRLRGFVVRADRLEGTLAVHTDLLGAPAAVTRGALSWRFWLRPDGRWPADGAVPCVIDWGPQGNPAATLPDLGARLADFALAHPDPEAVRRLHGSLGIDAPLRIESGPELRFTARIATLSGLRLLA